MKYCSKCGAKVENENSKFCVACGAPLKEIVNKSEYKSWQKQGYEKNPWTCLTLALVAIVGALVGLFFIKDDDSPFYSLFTLPALPCGIIAIVKSGHRGKIGIIGRILAIAALAVACIVGMIYRGGK